MVQPPEEMEEEVEEELEEEEEEEEEEPAPVPAPKVLFKIHLLNLFMYYTCCLLNNGIQKHF